MNKKLTKTIILIVFVVFLGITKVEAVSKICIYGFGDKTNTLYIDDSYSSVEIGDGSNAHGKVKNWSSGHKSGFSGYDYFIEHGKTCPPILLQEKNGFIIDAFGTDDLWFTDAKNMQKVKDYIDDKVWVYDLIGEKNGEGARADTSNNNSVTTITSKTCSCSGTDKGKKMSVTINVSDDLSEPRVKVRLGDKTNGEYLQNWQKPITAWGTKTKTTYTYMKDLMANNKCPDYAMLYAGTDWYFAVSDEENLSEVKEVLQEHWSGKATVYTVGCQETVIDNTPTTSNRPTTSNEYDDPSINSNVTPLSPDFDTYSCGGNYLTGIPKRIPKLTKFIYIFLQILVPIAIIILGSLDLLKAVGGQKEDEIKKGQQVFIKRLVGAAIVFFVFAIVKFVISLVSDNSTSIINCMDCFLKNNDSCIKE